MQNRAAGGWITDQIHYSVTGTQAGREPGTVAQVRGPLEKICEKKGGGEGAVNILDKIRRGSYNGILDNKQNRKVRREFTGSTCNKKDESSSPLHASLFKGLMTRHFISTMKPEQLIRFPYCSSSWRYAK